MLKQHFPYAAIVAVLAPVAAGDIALAIMALALAIGFVPCVYGRDVDEIVERTFEPPPK
jgi:hypothetical protein